MVEVQVTTRILHRSLRNAFVARCALSAATHINDIKHYQERYSEHRAPFLHRLYEVDAKAMYAHRAKDFADRDYYLREKS